MLLAINFFKCAILIERVLSFEDDSKRAFSDSSLNEVLVATNVSPEAADKMQASERLDHRATTIEDA